MSYSSRVYRHRNAHTHENENDNDHSSFFNKADKQSAGAKQGNAFFQAKLSVNQPGDQFEREADSVASAVVNNTGASPAVQQKEISGIQRLATSAADEKISTDEERMKRDKEIQTKPQVQRKCSQCEKEEKDKAVQTKPQVQRKCAECEKEEKEKGNVQTKSEGGGSTASPQLSSRITNAAGTGNALPAKTLNEMQSSFGANFSDVNIHTDSDAADMNEELGAQAFTHGNDIYFNSGKFNPDTSSGKHLLAHELTHVIQQDGGDSSIKKKIMPYRKSGSFRFNEKFPNLNDGLKEEEFTDAQKQPWLEKITVDFNATRAGSSGDIMPQGTLTGKYFANKANEKDFSHTVTGGSSQIGFTDKGPFTVTRIEGAGYNQTVEKDGVGPKKHYDKDVTGGSMSYAVFFVGSEALHAGSLSEGSHACVHVNWDKMSQIRRINFHSVVGKTQVEINYTDAVLKKICCDRRKQKGVKDNEVLPNPCNNIKASACKSGGGGGGGKTGSLCVPVDIVAAAFENDEAPAMTYLDEYNADNTSYYESDLVGLKLNDGLYYGTWEKRPRVHKLQEKLTAKGFYAKSDGMFGPKTLAALQGFQETHLLPATEIVDPETARLLESNDTPTCPKGYVPVPNNLIV